MDKYVPVINVYKYIMKSMMVIGVRNICMCVCERDASRKTFPMKSLHFLLLVFLGVNSTKEKVSTFGFCSMILPLELDMLANQICVTFIQLGMERKNVRFNDAKYESTFWICMCVCVCLQQHIRFYSNWKIPSPHAFYWRLSRPKCCWLCFAAVANERSLVHSNYQHFNLTIKSLCRRNVF